MKEMSKVYDPSQVEERLYRNWEESGAFHMEPDKTKTPFTIVIHPQVPRIPVIMVEDSRLRDSFFSRGTVTLKNRLPESRRTLNFFPFFRIWTVEYSSSLMTLVSSRLMYA